jgi:HPt (histidine-containing phosphotransfer) domain-containing protein
MKKNSASNYSVDKLMHLADGDKAFVLEMITLFLLKASESQQVIVESLHNKEYKKLADQAHKLKSSIQIVANSKLHQLVKDIEKQALDENVSALNKSIEELELQMKGLIIYLRNVANDLTKVN